MKTFGLIGLILGALSYLHLYRKSKDAFQPTAIMIIVWWFGVFVASLKLASFQHEWSIKTKIVITLTGLLFWGISFINMPSSKRRIYHKRQIDINKSFYNATSLFMLYCFVSTAYIGMYIRLNGIRVGIVDQKLMAMGLIQNLNPFLLYGHILIPYSVLCAVFCLLYGSNSKKMKLLYILFVGYGIVYTATIVRSRDNLTSFLFGIMYMVARKQKWRLLKAVFVAVGVVAGLTLLMLLRVNTGSAIYAGTFNNVALNASYNYISSSFENLNSIINDGSHNMPLANTCILLYKLLGIYNEELMSFGNVYNIYGIYNASPIIGCYYFDLGIVGVVLGILFVGSLLKHLYKRSFQNIYFILFMSMFAKGIFTIPLGDNIINHGSFNALIGYIIVFGIAYYSQMKKRYFLYRYSGTQIEK